MYDAMLPPPTPSAPPPPVRMTHEKEVTSLSNQILDAQRLRDVSDSAHGQLKVKLKVTEEHRDRLERELTETNRRLKDGTVAGGGGEGRRYSAVLVWTDSYEYNYLAAMMFMVCLSRT